MYTSKSTTYADAGHVLRRGSEIRYQAQGEGWEEVPAPCSDLRVASGIAFWGGGLCALSLEGCATYADIKTKLVKIRYSLDDQMAVVCNAKPDEMARMQRWREWAAEVARTICRRTGIKV